jgi:hypothetical protein
MKRLPIEMFAWPVIWVERRICKPGPQLPKRLRTISLYTLAMTIEGVKA